MGVLEKLSLNQRNQLRDAFKVIDGESKDAMITDDDLTKILRSLGNNDPTEAVLNMLGDHKSGMDFTGFLNSVGKDLQKFDNNRALIEAMELFRVDGHDPRKDNTSGDKSEIFIDLERLKDAVCSVSLKEGSEQGNKFSRFEFDELVRDFIREEVNGKKVFLASKWISQHLE